LTSFSPTPQLSIDLKRVDIYVADRTSAPPTPELESAYAFTMNSTDQARFLQGLARGDLVGIEASNGIAFGDDPSTTPP
jgi:hypothetical protein